MGDWSDWERTEYTTTNLEGKLLAQWEKGRCFICTFEFKYDPKRVPRVAFIDSRATEPLCRECVLMVNARRRAVGVAEIPLPPGAYDYSECDRTTGGAIKKWTTTLPKQQN